MVQADAPRALIFAKTVEGTPVFNHAKQRIGHIDDVAIGKVDGKVAYAILSLGGFLGLGERYHPIPWDMLTYDTDLNGYVVSLDKQQLENAPSYSKDELADIGDTDERLRDQVYGYYGAGPW